MQSTGDADDVTRAETGGQSNSRALPEKPDGQEAARAAEIRKRVEELAAIGSLAP